jgi:hypothetical protein
MATSQSRAVPSPPAVASVLPPGSNAAAWTGLSLLEEVPRYLGVDQDRCADQQHHHVRPELVDGGVTVAFVATRRPRLGDRTRRAHSLGHDDGRLCRDGAGPAAERPSAGQAPPGSAIMAVPISRKPIRA